MHILIVPSEIFVTQIEPLAGVFQFEQAKALSNTGHKVGVVSVGFITMRYLFKFYPYNERQNEGQLNIFRKYRRSIYIERYLNSNYNISRYISIFKRLYGEYEVEHGRPDIVHAHNFLYAGFLAEWLWDTYKIPFIITEHSSSFVRGFVPHSLDLKLKSIINKAAIVSSVSGVLSNTLKNRFDRNFDILPNIVDEIFFNHTLDSRFDIDKFIFLSVSSIDSNKNQSLLLKSFASGFRGTSEQLRIGGDGPLIKNLITLAEELGIIDQVQFLGHLSREEVSSEMRQAHCFILPSNHETFGVVLIEALASGLPLLATKCGGPEDIINDGNGLLVDVGSQDQLTDAMNFIKINHRKYNSNDLRTEALAKFGEHAFVKNACAMYEKGIKK
jgi:glycosyltransferase involved in cell wall biosynthesis